MNPSSNQPSAMTTPSSEPLPCPFCGFQPKRQNSVVWCETKGCVGRGMLVAEIPAWNRRAVLEAETGRWRVEKGTAEDDLGLSPAPIMSDAELLDWLTREGHTLCYYGKHRETSVPRWQIPDWPEATSPRAAIRVAIDATLEAELARRVPVARSSDVEQRLSEIMERLEDEQVTEYDTRWLIAQLRSPVRSEDSESARPSEQRPTEDTERLDWIETHTTGDVTICPPKHHGGDEATWLVSVEIGHDRHGYICDEKEGRTLREAIDAARRGATVSHSSEVQPTHHGANQ